MQKIKNLISRARISTNRVLGKRSLMNLNSNLVKSFYSVSKAGKHIFFGYHDVTPFNQDDSLILFSEISTKLKKEELTVGYFELKEKAFHKIGTTSSWCWQQGARLQWYDPSKNYIIYNTKIAGRHISTVRSLNGEEIEQFPIPTYSLSREGGNIASLHFPRLQRLRPGYGYSDIPDNTINELAPDHTGIEIFNVKSRTSKCIVTIKDLTELNDIKAPTKSSHYVNHLLWNPTGTKLMFFHLWATPLGARHSTCFIWDMPTNKFVAIEARGAASHYTWISSYELIIYLLGDDAGFYLFDTITLKKTKIPTLGNEDLHPMSGETNLSNLVLDSYPCKKFKERRLFTSDINKDSTLLEIASFYSPPSFQKGEYRCDLHSRWSHSKKNICVDSAHNGKREMTILSLN